MFKNQTLFILNYLQKNKKGITSLDAFDFKITRLSARIYDLRQQGYDIRSVRELSPEADSFFCRYYLIKNK